MTIFVDFDDTLFDTLAAHKEFARRLSKKYKITPRKYKNTWNRVRAISPGLYDYENILEDIAESQDIPVARLKKEASSFFEKHAHKFLFDDVPEFLEAMKGCRVVLITAGNKKFQRMKVKGAKLDSGVNEVVLTEWEPKGEFLKKHLRKKKYEKPFFFIDDRVHQLENVEKHVPHMHCIHMCRKNSRFGDRSPRGFLSVKDFSSMSNMDELII